MTNSTDFGYRNVAEDQKAHLVEGVFDAVAPRYDLMNDLMSVGLHRLWKRFAVGVSGVRPGDRVLDVAGGTGDLARLFARRVGHTGQVVLSDINGRMLARGRDRLADEGLLPELLLCDAERLPFPSGYFDCVCIAFGLRNVTHKEVALAEMTRVLRPGGQLMVLEFSRIWAPLSGLYDVYSFQVLPRLGKAVAGDAEAYRYLAESIRRHPGQEELCALMEAAGLERVRFHNLAAGAVALHRGWRL